MKIPFLPLVAFTLGLALLVGCGTPETGAGTRASTLGTPSAQATPNTAITMPVSDTTNPAANQPPVAGSVSYDIVRSLDKAVAQAEIIVVGKVVGTGKAFNAARDTRDPNKEAPNQYDVGQEYNFQVDQYLKGNGPKVLTVEQVEGAIISPPDKVTPADIKRAREAYGAMPLEIGRTYLLLLTTLTESNGKIHYGGSFEPWRFVLNDDGTGGVFAPGSVTLNLPETFVPNPDAPFIPQIEQIIQNQQAGTP